MLYYYSNINTFIPSSLPTILLLLPSGLLLLLSFSNPICSYYYYISCLYLLPSLNDDQLGCDFTYYFSYYFYFCIAFYCLASSSTIFIGVFDAKCYYCPLEMFYFFYYLFVPDNFYAICLFPFYFSSSYFSLFLFDNVYSSYILGSSN